MTKPHTAKLFRRFLNECDDTGLMRIQYCYQLGSTFVHLSLMEDMIIRAMSMCDGIKVAKVLGPDVPKWEQLIHKTREVEGSTLGNMIQILSKHGILSDDLKYLRWVKEKRDIFVHRLFRGGEWPGELDADECQMMVRRLRYLEIVFERASPRIWPILARVNLMEITNFGSDGILAMNPGVFSDEEASPSDTPPTGEVSHTQSPGHC
jgi:hypothetical protein